LFGTIKNLAETLEHGCSNTDFTAAAGRGFISGNPRSRTLSGSALSASYFFEVRQIVYNSVVVSPSFLMQKIKILEEILVETKS
jgi:hypothetical protein